MEGMIEYRRLGDSGDVVNLCRLCEIWEIWEIFSLKRSVGTGIVAVLPGKFLKSLRNHTPHQVGGLFGGTLVVGLIYGASGVCTRCMVLFDEWLGVLGSVVFVCWTIPLQDDTPVCHDCLVVDRTSSFIINIPSRPPLTGFLRLFGQR